MFKKIKDERLILKNLKNIRVAFLVQSLGIVIILAKDLIDGKNIFGSPLFFLFILTMVVFNVLNLGVSIDNDEPSKKSIINSYTKVTVTSVSVGVVFTIIYIILSPDRSLIEASIAGLMLFLCFLIVFSIAYFIQKKRMQDFDE